MTLDPRVDIGHVHLEVADIQRSLDFSCVVLGFELQQCRATGGIYLRRRLPPPHAYWRGRARTPEHEARGLNRFWRPKGAAQFFSVSEAPSAGVGLKRSYTVPLQAMRSAPVHTIALPSRELSGDGPGVIVCQVSVSRS